MENDINEYYYDEHFEYSREYGSETHDDSRCKYIRKPFCEVYDADEDYVIYDVLILIRLCKCGKYRNRARRIKYKTQFQLHAIGDGLEAELFQATEKA